MAVRSDSFEEFSRRIANSAAWVTAGISEDQKDLSDSYSHAIRFVFGMLSGLIIESREIRHSVGVYEALTGIAENDSSDLNVFLELKESTKLDILDAVAGTVIPDEFLRDAVRVFLTPDRDLSLNPMFFATIPASWISLLYERLLGLKPSVTESEPGVELKRDFDGRKRSGSFFTPPYIVDYIVSKSLSNSRSSELPRVLDPSMGAGDFLLKALSHLSGTRKSADVAANCIFGCDIDPIAVDIARFLVWLESGGTADTELIAKHLVCADALSDEQKFDWHTTFSDVLIDGGFDAVIGNPPYIAAKNKSMREMKESRTVRGQSDYYLLFLESVMDKSLVRQGGSMAMVLPDPFLVRANAAHVRERLLREWTINEIVHIVGAFPGAQVANIVPLCTNQPPSGGDISVVRLDKADHRRMFEINPQLTAAQYAKPVQPSFALVQPRSEVLYLVEGKWQEVFERIHGPEKSLKNIKKPFAGLESLGVEAIFRGEEIGKKIINSSEGELPILLGGESLQRYDIKWEGRCIDQQNVAKPMNWYSAPKIVLQKSSAQIVAAYDTEGYVVPQSVYGIKLGESDYNPLYVLAILNSKFMSEYVFRSFTGYKLVQPQIELEDVKRLPIRLIKFNTEEEERSQLFVRGKRQFKDEFFDWSEHFTDFASLIDGWMDEGKEDVIHDVLAWLGEFAVTFRQEKNTNAMLSRRIDQAIDIVVDRLYGMQSPVPEAVLQFGK